MRVQNRQGPCFHGADIPEGGGSEQGNRINKKIAPREQLVERPWGRTMHGEVESCKEASVTGAGRTRANGQMRAERWRSGGKAGGLGLHWAVWAPLGNIDIYIHFFFLILT